jgi:hypothetical protein
MLSSQWSKYIWKLLWIVGLFTLVIIYSQLEQSLKQYVATNFKMLPLVWFYSVVPVVFGAYIALLFVKIRSINLNFPLILCVTIPSLLGAFYMPVIFSIAQNTTSTTDSFNMPIPLWMYSTNIIGILSVVAGLTLIVGLFGRNEPTKK